MAVGLEFTCMVVAFVHGRGERWIKECRLSSWKGLRLSRRMSICLSVCHTHSASGIPIDKLSATPLWCSSESATPDR